MQRESMESSSGLGKGNKSNRWNNNAALELVQQAFAAESKADDTDDSLSDEETEVQKAEAATPLTTSTPVC